MARGPKTHELKTWPKYFRAILSGHKTFEARKNDRDFRLYDILRLREYDPDEGYSGRELLAQVSYVLDSHDFGIRGGYIIMALGGVQWWPEDGEGEEE